MGPQYSGGNQDPAGTAESVVISLWNHSDPKVMSKKGNDGQRRKRHFQRHYGLVKRTLSLLLYSVAFRHLLPNDVIAKGIKVCFCRR